MKPGIRELRFAYVLFFLLLLTTVIVVLMVPTPVALWVLVPLMAAQILAMWLAPQVVNVVRHHRRVRESYEQELDFARQVMESMVHGVTVADKHGQFVYANRAAAEIYGREPEEIVGNTAYALTAPEDHHLLRAAQQARQRGQGGAYSIRVQRPCGELVRVKVIGTPRFYQGRIVGSFAAVMPDPAEQPA
ncbi:PAS domain-containing protein [Deinococcus navajonensis]|uniref:PAS domain S-box protein n=1 Tax=Deinococcus navajonensis TaxID=309884 RepID=A0ABV8XQH5_9DEIO